MLCRLLQIPFHLFSIVAGKLFAASTQCLFVRENQRLGFWENVLKEITVQLAASKKYNPIKTAK